MPPKILRSFRADPASRSVAASHPTPVPVVGSYSNSTPTPLAGTMNAVVRMPPCTSRVATGEQLMPRVGNDDGVPVIFDQPRAVIHGGSAYVPVVDTALDTWAAV